MLYDIYLRSAAMFDDRASQTAPMEFQVLAIGSWYPMCLRCRAYMEIRLAKLLYCWTAQRSAASDSLLIAQLYVCGMLYSLRRRRYSTIDTIIIAHCYFWMNVATLEPAPTGLLLTCHRPIIGKGDVCMPTSSEVLTSSDSLQLPPCMASVLGAAVAADRWCSGALLPC